MPATVAIRDGRFLVGLADADLEALGDRASRVRSSRPPGRTSRRRCRGGWAATTVSATMIAAARCRDRRLRHRRDRRRPPRRPRRAPGGRAIGGRRPSLDISSDLEELARTPMRRGLRRAQGHPRPAVDARVPRDARRAGRRPRPGRAAGLLRALERGPGAGSRRRRGAAAGSSRTHLGLGLGSGMLACVPVPAAAALSLEVARAAVERATPRPRRPACTARP